MPDFLSHDHHHDGIDRRGFLSCMAWAGTGVLWTLGAGVLRSQTLGQIAAPGGVAPAAGELSFLQISDSHIGFAKEANRDVTATFQAALDKVNALPTPPAFLLHTGDLTQLSRPEEFDTVAEVLKSCRTKDVFYVPGEHDVLEDGGKLYRARFAPKSLGAGWQSFDKDGCHFIGLVNVVNLPAGGLGQLGEEQLAWLEEDVKGLGSSTPIVVFAHIPLWAVYPPWGWATSDSPRALAAFETVRLGHRAQRPHPPGAPEGGGQRDLPHGHVHRLPAARAGRGAQPRADEGAGRTTPQPARARQRAPRAGHPRAGHRGFQPELKPAMPKPILFTHVLAALGVLCLVPPGRGEPPGKAPDAPANRVEIKDFHFQSMTLTVPAGTRVVFVNRDDEPHTVASVDGKFAKSKALDTDQEFAVTLAAPGDYGFFCTVHPTMTGKITVTAAPAAKL